MKAYFIGGIYDREIKEINKHYTSIQIPISTLDRITYYYIGREVTNKGEIVEIYSIYKYPPEDILEEVRREILYRGYLSLW